MKNLITFLFYCLSVTAVIGQGHNVTRLSLLSNEKTETLLRLDLNGIDKHPVQTTPGAAVTLSMDGVRAIRQHGARPRSDTGRGCDTAPLDRLGRAAACL